MRKAVIVGCEGQDGRLLNDLLTKKGYRIVGLDKHIIKYPKGSRFKKIDITKREEVFSLIRLFKPHEVYYLAAFHHSSESLPDENVELLRHSYDAHVGGPANFLEAIKKFSRKTRLFYAGSSHIFGQAKNKLQDEKTPINPNCIYGITKAAGLALCRFYRSRYKIFAATGILYNHESALRSEKFVSMKIINGAINIRKGRQKELVLGDLRAVIDWGYAPDYVRAMHLIVNSKLPDDFIIATGKRHMVLDFVKAAFGYLGLDWKLYVKENRGMMHKQNFCRIGNPAKLKRVTGWKPSVDFKEMVKLLLVQQRGI